MKHLSLLLLALFGFAMLANAAPKGTPGSKLDPTRGYLELKVNIEGAEIFIDSKKVATSPANENVIVDPGKHTVKVKKKGYSDYAEVISCPAGKVTSVAIELLAVAGYLVVDTEDKEKAQVYLDGKFLGDTKYEGEIPIGPHELEVRRLGFFDFRAKFIAKGGQEFPFQASLQKLPPELDPLVKKNPLPVAKFIQTTPGKVVLGGSGGIGAGAIAATLLFLRASNLGCDGFGCGNDNDASTPTGKK